LIFSLLAFMLVFRLNRAAIRFWDCRAAWGAIVMRGRNLVRSIHWSPYDRVGVVHADP
jgi:putative membrane protein